MSFVYNMESIEQKVVCVLSLPMVRDKQIYWLKHANYRGTHYFSNLYLNDELLYTSSNSLTDVCIVQRAHNEKMGFDCKE